VCVCVCVCVSVRNVGKNPHQFCEDFTISVYITAYSLAFCHHSYLFMHSILHNIGYLYVLNMLYTCSYCTDCTPVHTVQTVHLFILYRPYTCSYSTDRIPVHTVHLFILYRLYRPYTCSDCTLGPFLLFCLQIC
jgi:hypothetical protein